MSALSLFDQAYQTAYKRGHVVWCAAIGMRQLKIGVGTSQEAANASFRLAEQVVDAAEEFLSNVKPRFQVVFSTHAGDKFIYADTSCGACGHPYCDLYQTAGMMPSRSPAPVPIIMTKKL